MQRQSLRVVGYATHSRAIVPNIVPSGTYDSRVLKGGDSVPQARLASLMCGAESSPGFVLEPHGDCPGESHRHLWRLMATNRGHDWLWLSVKAAEMHCTRKLGFVSSSCRQVHRESYALWEILCRRVKVKRTWRATAEFRRCSPCSFSGI